MLWRRAERNSLVILGEIAYFDTEHFDSLAAQTLMKLR